MSSMDDVLTDIHHYLAQKDTNTPVISLDTVQGELDDADISVAVQTGNGDKAHFTYADFQGVYTELTEAVADYYDDATLLYHPENSREPVLYEKHPPEPEVS